MRASNEGCMINMGICIGNISCDSLKIFAKCYKPVIYSRYKNDMRIRSAGIEPATF